jgi:hypothetical protein
MTVIPRAQYGFILGRSTTHAVGHVLQYISETLPKPKGQAYAIFIDYQEAFDGLNRSRVPDILHPVLGAESQIFKFIACILRENTIKIHDGLSERREPLQEAINKLQE